MRGPDTDARENRQRAKIHRMAQKEGVLAMKCRACKTKEAIIPDRATASRRKVFCLDCHKAKLRQDLRNLLGDHYSRQLRPSDEPT